MGVPIGLIHSSWGGSSIESWMDAEALSAFPHIKIPSSVPEKIPNQTPTILFQSMLHPFIGYTIKGVIWYQGDANRSRAAEYDELLAAMIHSWRKLWQQGDFPFYFEQIAPFDYKDANAAFLREAQLKTMLASDHTGMAVTLDLGEKNNIHPAQKMMVGERLVYWALANTYTIKGVQFSRPVYKQMQVKDSGWVVIGFDYAPMGLSSFGKPLTGFEIAGEDRVFYPATCTINMDKPGFITVWSEQVKQPVSVRYAFHSWTEASLFNTQGLPASSFRTDDW